MCDPASGKPGRALGAGTARSALVACARDREDRVFVLETWAARAAPEDLAAEIFAFNSRWQPQRFGIESAGQQNLFIGMVESLAARDGIALPIVRVQPNTRIHKIDRIQTAISPRLAAGQLFVRQPEDEELIAELRAFPTGATVDLADALASAIDLLGHVPASLAFEGGAAGRYNPDADYADFLREAGLSDEAIKARLKK